MSSPSEPEETVSTSMERSFLPSFITEPLPNWRSIWDSAADSALDLSMEDPSTIRRAVADIVVLLMAGIRERDKRDRIDIFGCGNTVTSLFSVRNMVFFVVGYWPFLNPRVPIRWLAVS